MTQTVACAFDQAAHQSADIVVTATTPALVAAYSDLGAAASGFQCTVVQKAPNGTYQQYYTGRDKPVILSQDQPHYELRAVGTFAVIKPVTTGLNLGVSLDQ